MQLLSQKPRIVLFRQQSSPKSIPPRFYFDSLPQLTIWELAGSRLKICPANEPPTQSKKTLFQWFLSYFLIESKSSLRQSQLYPAFFSSSSCWEDRLIPNIFLTLPSFLSNLISILLVFEAAALSTTVSAFEFLTMSAMPSTERGLIEHILISYILKFVSSGQTMTSVCFETTNSAQVPLFLLESTDTFRPIKKSFYAYLMIPEPQKPIMGNPSFLMPYRPRQKNKSEGLMGAYFILMSSS